MAVSYKLPPIRKLSTPPPVTPPELIPPALNEDDVQQLRVFAAQKPDSFRSMLNQYGVNEKSVKLLTKMYPEKSDVELSGYFKQPLDGKQVLMRFLGRRGKLRFQPVALGDRPSLQGAGATENLYNPMEEERAFEGGSFVPDAVVGVEEGMGPWGLGHERGFGDIGISRTPQESGKYKFGGIIPPEELWEWDEQKREWVPKKQRGLEV